MIRSAIIADIPRLVEMGQQFLAESSYRHKIANNPEKMSETVAWLIERGSVLVLEKAGELVGMMGYFTNLHFLSGEKVAGEVFWWVEPTQRGDGLRLIHEFERRAAADGVKHLHMIAPNDRVAGLYKRLGYEFVESTYQKTI